jgi:seryl-tRNA synthetase
VLDPKFIRENPEIVKHATLAKRLASPELVDAWLAADATRRNSQTQFDSLRNEQKRLGELVGKLKRELKAGTSQELEKLIAEANAIKMQQDALMADLTAAESDCQTIMLQLPAIPDPSWPVGKDERENVVVRTWSDPSRLRKNALSESLRLLSSFWSPRWERISHCYPTRFCCRTWYFSAAC